MICKRPMILVVEDDHEMNELECELLGLNGFQTQPAYDGTEAVALCDSIQPDAILMDVMLPGMDGFEACRCIRGKFNSAAPPVIMLTALDNNASEATGRECGATAYLTKPFDVDEVIGTLKTLV